MKKLLLLLLVFNSIYIFCNDFEFSKSSIKVMSFSEKEYSNSSYYSEGETFIPGIEIDSEIDEITILVNGKEYRESRLLLTNLNPGNYHLKFSKSGYVSEDIWLTYYEDKRVIIEISLERKVGYIKLETNVPEPEIYLDGIRINETSPIPTGGYNLKIKSFGYKEFTGYVYIHYLSTTKIKETLEKADFKFKDIEISKERFNPLAYGSFNENSFKISVNGPGKGLFKIIDADGNSLLVEDIVFTTWNYFYDFNGIINNNFLDNGEYKIEVIVDKESISRRFIVDKKLFIKVIPIYRETSGLLLSPTGEFNKLKTMQTSFSGFFANNNTVLSFSHVSTNNNGLSLFGGMNLNLNVDVQNVNAFFGFKAGFKLGFLSLCPQINYKIGAGIQEDIGFNYNTFGLYIPVTIPINKINFSFSPGASYTIDQDIEKEASIGIHFDNQKIRYGISSNINTINFNNFDILFGCEFNYLIPKSQSYIGASFKSDDRFNLGAGLSINLLY